MRFAATHITDFARDDQIAWAIGELRDELDAPIDLLFIFATSQVELLLTNFVRDFQDQIGTSRILGCTAESVIANELELQWEPAITLWAGSLPDANIDLCHLQYKQSPDGGAFVGWDDKLLGQWQPGSTLMVLGDPFSFPVDLFLNRINEDRPGVKVVGGMCSGGAAPGESRLVMGDQVFTDGAVIARLSGGFDIHTVVSQGCRPIGTPMVVTRSEGNELLELGGGSALAAVNEVFSQLPTNEQKMVNQGLHVGRVINEYQERFSYGDFLIRNVIGANEKAGSIVIADYLRPGQTIQFHIRDDQTAHADLRQWLADAKTRYMHGAIRSGLLVSCNGRGTRLFQTPNHDAGLVQEMIGPIPLSGFFAAGEVGPIGGSNFVHGFTASLALFVEL